MRVVVLLALCTLALATPLMKPGYHHEHKVADKTFLKKQLDVLYLFDHVHQYPWHKDYETYGKEFHMEEHLDWWTKPEVVKEFWHHWKYGMLPKDEIFSVFHHDHLEEAISLFKIFYYAKDWETFLKAAWWARGHVNEGMFIYSLSVALVHRPDAQQLILPPIYEVYPYYFFPTEVIHEAQKHKMLHPGLHTEVDGFKGWTIHANYSGWYLNLHPEQSMGYFTEDVGLNAFYWYYHLYYPFWMDTKEFHLLNPHRGEQFYYLHEQLLARYYMERLSNGFGEIPTLDYEYPTEYGYHPSLTYPNGMEFPVRPHHVDWYHHHMDDHQSHAFYYKNYTYSYYFIKDYERRIRDAIDLGFVWTHDGKKVDLFTEHGFEVLGDMIEGNPDSPHSHFYGMLQVFARYFLGWSYLPLDKYHIAPSALEHFETSLRDPMFYQFFKRIVMYFQKYKSHLPPYKYEDLHFPGVEVESVELDKLITYFDYFYSDLSHAVYVTKEEWEHDTFHIRAKQERLNFKPFSYKVHVKSEKPTDAVVRVFFAPKYDEYGRVFNVTWNRLNFVEFDRFIWKLNAGENVMERFSHDNWFAHDYPTYHELYDKVKAAYEGKGEFEYYDHDYYYGMPKRLMLPKGTEEGMHFDFFVIVTPYHPEKVEGDYEWYWPVGFDHKYVDGHSYGWPFDRPIYDEHYFHVPNAYFHEVPIYHRDIEHINAPHHHHDHIHHH